MEATPEKRKNTRQIIRLLKKEHPDARCSLDHSNPLELLVATILSAQCTDERVNLVTADLFRKYRTWRDYADAPTAELERVRMTMWRTHSCNGDLNGMMARALCLQSDDNSFLFDLLALLNYDAYYLTKPILITPDLVADARCAARHGRRRP